MRINQTESLLGSQTSELCSKPPFHGKIVESHRRHVWIGSALFESPGRRAPCDGQAGAEDPQNMTFPWRNSEGPSVGSKGCRPFGLAAPDFLEGDDVSVSCDPPDHFGDRWVTKRTWKTLDIVRQQTYVHYFWILFADSRIDADSSKVRRSMRESPLLALKKQVVVYDINCSSLLVVVLLQFTVATPCHNSSTSQTRSSVHQPILSASPNISS